MKHVRAFSVVMVVAMVLVGQAIMAESVQAWWTGAVGPLSNHHGEMTRDALKEGLGWSDTEIGTIPEKSDKYADDTSPYKHGTGCTHRVKKYQDIFNQKSTTDDCYDLGAEFCAAKFLGNAKYFYSVGDTANGEKYLGLAIHFIEDSLCPAHVFPMKQGLALTASHTWCEMNTHNDYATYWSPTVRSYAPISINNPVQLEDRLVTEADYVYSLRCGYFEEGSDQGMIYPNGVVDNPRYETWEMSDSDLNSIFQKIGGLVQGAAIWATTIKTLGDAVDNTGLSWTASSNGEANWFGQTATSYYGGDAAQSGDITHGYSTWLQTTVNESGTLTFYWKVSSEATYDYLVFYVDWIEMARISGSVDWQQKSYTISPGTHTLQWRYVKNGSGDGGSDCGWVDKVEFTPDAPGALGEALDNTSLTWTTGGSPTEWFPQTTTSYYGGDAAQSGDIPDDRYTWLQTTVSESGTLTFYWKVSSEATNDYLVFYVDWIEMARISGSVDWQQKSYTISPGTHTLQWRYIKNGSISNGSDCGWVDKVEFTPDTPGALGEAVDNMALTWITGGSPTEWFAQTVVSYYGGDAAQSGDIPDDRYTWLQTTVSESGTLTFYWKVSSEATNDYLVFYVDWIEMARISGSVDWQQKSYTISPGTHTLQWRYIKNGSISNGSDCGWVDKVEFPSPSTTEVGIYPPSQEVTRGESFSVNVAVDPKVAIAGVQFDLSFDSSLITAVSVEEGNLLNQNGANTYFSAGTIDNGLGTITGVACSITKAGGTVSSPGVFAIINFTAKDAQGTSPLDLSNVMVGDINGDPVPIAVGGGNVTIGRTGDVNNDDHVDVLDMILIGQHWEETGSSGWIPEDVKKDGVINVLDMIIIGQHWTG